MTYYPVCSPKSNVLRSHKMRAPHKLGAQFVTVGVLITTASYLMRSLLGLANPNEGLTEKRGIQGLTGDLADDTYTSPVG